MGATPNKCARTIQWRGEVCIIQLSSWRLLYCTGLSLSPSVSVFLQPAASIAQTLLVDYAGTSSPSSLAPTQLRPQKKIPGFRPVHSITPYRKFIRPTIINQCMICLVKLDEVGDWMVVGEVNYSRVTGCKQLINWERRTTLSTDLYSSLTFFCFRYLDISRYFV